MKKQILLVASILLFGFLIVPAQMPAEQPRTINGGVINGKATSLIKPEYPAAAQAISAGGAVNVQVLIDENGSVVSANAVSGHPLLRQAAEAAARESRFSPTSLSGQPVKVTGIIVYNFTPSASFKISAMDAPTIGTTAPDRVISRDSNTISGGVVNGKARNLVKPAYPAAARAVGAQGAVNVQVTIDENGDVISANAVSGHPLLRSAAEQAAAASNFAPTLLQGQAVKVTGIIVYNFIADKNDGKTSWFKVGYDLASVQYAPSLMFLNTNSIDKIFQPDWTSEKQQLQRLTEIKSEGNSNPSPVVLSERKVSENTVKRADGTTVKTMVMERSVRDDNQPTGEQIAISQSLIASLQGRLASDQTNLWQFNTGVSIIQAISYLRNPNERQRALDLVRQQINSAPVGISADYLANLQKIAELLEKPNPAADERQQIGQIMSRMFAY